MVTSAKLCVYTVAGSKGDWQFYSIIHGPVLSDNMKKGNTQQGSMQ